MENQRLSSRLNSCREVLQAINEILGRNSVNSQVAQQMEHLERLMVALDARAMTENDMQRIEFSTNQLFGELQRIFRPAGMDGLAQQERLH